MAFLLAEDRALKALLQGVTVSDPNDATRDIGVWFRWPQKEVRAADFPFITLDLADIQRARLREQRGLIDPSKGYDIPGYTPDGLTTTAARAEMPIPVDLIYTVGTYSLDPRHDRQLLYSLLSVDRLPFRNGTLPVADNGEDGVTERYMELLQMQKADYRDADGVPVYRNLFHVKVSSELLNATVREVAKALSIDIDLRPNDPDTTAPDNSALDLETISLTF